MRSVLRASSPLALAVALTALAVPAHAAITAYSTSATFTATLLAGSYRETFTGTTGSGTASIPFSGGTPTVAYTVTAPSNTTSDGVYRSGTIIGNNLPGESLAFTPTSGNISAFGGEFFITNVSDTFQAQPVTLTVTDSLGASLSQTYTPTSASVGSFRGFTSTGTITSIVLSAPNITAANYYNSVDNVIAGRVAAVPEPATMAALALGAVAMLRRRKRA